MSYFPDLRYGTAPYYSQPVACQPEGCWKAVIFCTCFLARCPSGCPSVTRVDQSKTDEVRVMQFTAHSSLIVKQGWVWETCYFRSSNAFAGWLHKLELLSQLRCPTSNLIARWRHCRALTVVSAGFSFFIKRIPQKRPNAVLRQIWQAAGRVCKFQTYPSKGFFQGVRETNCRNSTSFRTNIFNQNALWWGSSRANYH